MTTPSHCTNHCTEIAPLQVLLHYDDADRGNAVETYGLSDHGLPELEIAQISPAYLLSAAAALIEDIGGYMLDRGQPIRSGETVMVGPSTAVRLERVEPCPRGPGRLRVIELEPERCPLCEGVDHDLWSDAWPRSCCEGQHEPDDTDAAVPSARRAGELPN